MNVLILGGTRFLGRALAEAALERGHRVTLFHRGQTGARLLPECERILGDRGSDLDRLGALTFDAVFDTCGFVPRVVRAAAVRLADSASHYAFISSISAYAEPLAIGAGEDAPLATLADPSREDVTGETYGALKALCEREISAAFGNRALIARAGLLVGPNDTTDRFPYWVKRLARGGDVMVPDAPLQPLQLIDVRDAAAWLVRMAEARAGGTYNLTGPARALSLGEFFGACRAALGSDARFVPVSESFLRERRVEPWSELPLWTGGGDGFLSVAIDRALASGLALRSLDATVLDTFAWSRGRGEPFAATAATPQPNSLSIERECELLEAWAARSG
ncbi:MAG: NAD-dependent epimerase/dehydratase family protein [Candidatus Eisenbacteria bacterium]|nr:NAD-dependent epimerase/dehydratase family protein [Candidatus Eisenbacteria bacterium]